MRPLAPARLGARSYLQPVVEHDDVRLAAPPEHPQLGPPGERAGHGGRGRDRVDEGSSECVQVPHRVDHRHDAAGKDAVGAAGDAVADLDLDAAEAELRVAGTGGCDRVGDERDPARRRPPDELRGLGREVMPVEDHLDDHVVADERGARDPGVAVAERPHRVEEVRDGADSPIEGGVGLGGSRVGMAARDDDAALDGAGRRARARPAAPARASCGHRPCGEQPLEQLPIGIAPRRSRVRAEPPLREERPFEMGAEDARARLLSRGHLLQRCDQGVLGRGDQRRLVRRDAAFEQRLAGRR